MLTELLAMKVNISVLDGLLYALIGFVFVFIGIGILIGILYLLGYVMQKTNGKISFKKKTAAAPVKEESVAPAVAATEEVPDEVKAAIVAAIMAYYSAEKPKCEFVVKQIKRI
jgi:sodium pump decarboxylase gamma subunit